MQTFEVKDPLESVPLTFNMGPGLLPGEFLVSAPTVNVVTEEGADGNPFAILNGLPQFDPTMTRVVVPVLGGINGVEYELIVTCPTTNPFKVLTLTAVLPVRRI